MRPILAAAAAAVLSLLLSSCSSPFGRVPPLVTEECGPVAGSGQWCVQLRDDGTERGGLWVTWRVDGEDIPRHTYLPSPFTFLGSDTTLDVEFEADRIVVAGRHGAQLVLPEAFYALN